MTCSYDAYLQTCSWWLCILFYTQISTRYACPYFLHRKCQQNSRLAQLYLLLLIIVCPRKLLTGILTCVVISCCFVICSEKNLHRAFNWRQTILYLQCGRRVCHAVAAAIPRCCPLTSSLFLPLWLSCADMSGLIPLLILLRHSQDRQY